MKNCLHIAPIIGYTSKTVATSFLGNYIHSSFNYTLWLVQPSGIHFSRFLITALILAVYEVGNETITRVSYFTCTHVIFAFFGIVVPYIFPSTRRQVNHPSTNYAFKSYFLLENVHAKFCRVFDECSLG